MTAMACGRWAAAALLLLLVAPAQVEALHAHSAADVEETTRDTANTEDESAHAEGAERPVIVDVKPPETAKRFPYVKQWDFMPNQPRIGIVTGALKDFYDNTTGGFGDKTMQVLRAYAKRKNYALVVNKDLGAMSDRPASWNKIIMMHKYMDDVPILAWIDPNIFITNPETSLENLMKRSPCDGAHQSRWEQYIPKEQHHNTWLWMASGMRAGGKDKFLINSNSAMMMVRRTETAKAFLERVWNVGEDRKLSERHSYSNKDRIPGWPFDNGAIWETLASNPEKYLRNTCITPPGVFFSKWDSEYTQFGRLCDKNTPGVIRNTLAATSLAKMQVPGF